MARLDDLPVEIKTMVWAFVVQDDAVTIAHKKFPRTSNSIPSVCSPTSAHAYSRESANIIHEVLLKHAVEDPTALYANVLNFDFTNLIRFIKYYVTTTPKHQTPRGDISRLAHIEDDAAVEVRHTVNTSLEYQPAKLTTWIKFANELHKKTGVQLGTFHRLHFVDESPAFWDLVDSVREMEPDGSQTSLIGDGLHNWRCEAQWVVVYGSVEEGLRRNRQRHWKFCRRSESTEYMKDAQPGLPM